MNLIYKHSSILLDVDRKGGTDKITNLFFQNCSILDTDVRLILNFKRYA